MGDLVRRIEIFTVNNGYIIRGRGADHKPELHACESLHSAMAIAQRLLAPEEEKRSDESQ